MATNFYNKVSIGGGGGGGSVVTSVNGRNGAVTLDKTDVGLNNVDNVSLLAQDLAQKEPTGFPNRTDSGISFVDFTRTLFISATGAQFDFWVKGINYVYPSGVAIGKQISNVTGNHYVYFDPAGNIQETTVFSPDLFTDNCMIAIIYWNASTGSHVYFGEERHGMQMDGGTHSYLHTVFGTRYLSGLALQNFVADGSGGFDVNAQFTADQGQIRDEDILLNIVSQSQFPVLYRDGASSWKKKTPDAYPVIYAGSVAGYAGSLLAFNEFTGGNWQLTQVTDNNYVLMHLFATNDIDNPVVAILGIDQYVNAPDARSNAETEINSLTGLPFAEFTAIGSVIFQTRSVYTNVPKARVVSSNPAIGEVYVDFRGEQLYTPSGVATSHSLLSNLDSDDHTQYFDQTRGDARYVQSSTVTGAVTSIVSSDLTSSRALESDPSGKVAVSAVTSAELSFVSGVTSPIQTQFSGKFPIDGSVAYVSAVVANATPSAMGVAAPSSTGAATAVTPTGTNYYNTRKIVEYIASSLSSAIAGWRIITEYCFRGNSANLGGFKFSTTFGFQSGFASGGTNRRFFCGFTSSTSGPADVNPSSLGTTQDVFGVGLDSNDANFQIMHSNGSVTCTKINLGSAFPRPTADKANFYKFEIHVLPNDTVMTYSLKDMITGDVVTGSVNTNLPLNTSALSPRCWLSAGGVASGVGVALEYMYLQNGA